MECGTSSRVHKEPGGQVIISTARIRPGRPIDVVGKFLDAEALG
jgi:hypothetical protein